MGKLLVIAILAAAVPLAALRAEEAGIKAEATRSQLYIGESFIVQVTISGTSDPGDLAFANASRCRIRPLGSQKMSNYQISIVNGKVVREGFSGVVASYEITPLEAGRFQPGPISVTIDGKPLTILGPVVTVTAIENQDVVAIAVLASHETCLVDEPFDVTLSVRIRRLPGDHANMDPLFVDSPPVLSIPWLEDPKLEALNAPDIRKLLNSLLIANWNQPGLAINNITVASDPFDLSTFFSHEARKARFILPRQIVTEKRTSYFDYALKLTYTAREEGNFVFGPAVFKGPVPVAFDTAGRPTGTNIFAVGPACTVRVIPPPEVGRPASFTGAMGTNLAARASLDASECMVGDPLKLTLMISGVSRVDKIMPPKLSLQDAVLSHFTPYDNTVQTTRGDQYVTFSYTVRPNDPGDYAWPSLELSYYDTKLRRYQVIATEPIPLHVKKGVEITASQLLGNTNLLQDVRRETDPMILPVAPIRTEASGAVPASLYGSPAWLAVAGAGPGVFLAVSLLLAWRRGRGKRVRASLQARAVSRARKEWAACQRQGLPPEALSRELCRIICTYLHDRGDAPGSGLTPPDVRAALLRLAVPPDVTERLAAGFESHFNAAFSGGTGGRPSAPGNHGETFTELENVERTLARKRKGAP